MQNILTYTPLYYVIWNDDVTYLEVKLFLLIKYNISNNTIYQTHAKCGYVQSVLDFTRLKKLNVGGGEFTKTDKFKYTQENLEVT
jgi:hypothetical protein